LKILAIALPIIYSVAIFGILAIVAWRKEHGAPLGWRHVGTPPQGVDHALEALRDLCSGMRWGGTIEWVEGPLHIGRGAACDDLSAHGQVLDFRKHRIRLQRFPEVWETSLAHEIHHLWRYAVDGQHDEPEGEGFRRWVNDANSAIASATSVPS
jgi:hypothetical protein